MNKINGKLWGNDIISALKIFFLHYLPKLFIGFELLLVCLSFFMSKFCKRFRLRLRKICLVVTPVHNLNIHTHPHCHTFVFSSFRSAKGEVQSKKSWMLSSAQIPSTPTNETPVRPEYLTPMTFMGDKGVSFGVNGEYVACLMGQKLRVYSFKDQTVQRSVYPLWSGSITFQFHS